MKRRGFTLIELLVAAILTAIIVSALSTAFAVTVHHQLHFTEPRARFEGVALFEDQVKNQLMKATVTNDPGQTTFFIADSLSGDSSVSDRLVFTVIGNKPSAAAANNTETDFASRNQTIGPVGGVTEVGISMTPVGDSGSLNGLFLRKQTPSDSDPESGGYESLLSEDVTTFELEFWDSTAWVATWDSRTENRLPGAVRVRYTLSSDADTQHGFVVRLPNAQGGQQG